MLNAEVTSTPAPRRLGPDKQPAASFRLLTKRGELKRITSFLSYRLCLGIQATTEAALQKPVPLDAN
jgi:hypothetical protein